VCHEWLTTVNVLGIVNYNRKVGGKVLEIRMKFLPISYAHILNLTTYEGYWLTVVYTFICLCFFFFFKDSHKL
jgi:hypothetical protein